MSMTTQKATRWSNIVITLCWTINIFIFMYILGQRLGLIRISLSGELYYGNIHVSTANSNTRLLHNHNHAPDSPLSAPDSRTYIATDFPHTLSEADPDIYQKSTTAMSFQESSAYPLFRGYSEHDINSLNGPWGGIVRLGPDKRPFLLSMWHEVRLVSISIFFFQSLPSPHYYNMNAQPIIPTPHLIIHIHLDTLSKTNQPTNQFLVFPHKTNVF
jgi:hypothetical protein